MLFADLEGVSSIERALFTGAIRPTRPSELVAPEIQGALVGQSLKDLRQRMLSVYNKLDGQYMLFIPNDALTKTRGFTYKIIRGLKIKAWSTNKGWNWRAACRSQEGRVFFARDNKIFVYGSRNDKIHADYVDDQEEFDDDTAFTDKTGWTPVHDVDAKENGIGIDFAFELPWADLDKRMNVKKLRYIGMDTEGTAQFYYDLFTDNLYEDRSDTGEAFNDDTLFTDGTGFQRDDPLRIPFASIQMRGGDARGFGSAFGTVFGSGRITSDERLYAVLALFKIMKIRVRGCTKEPLKIVSISNAYSDGSIRHG